MLVGDHPVEVSVVEEVGGEGEGEGQGGGGACLIDSCCLKFGREQCFH